MIARERLRHGKYPGLVPPWWHWALAVAATLALVWLTRR